MSKEDEGGKKKPRNLPLDVIDLTARTQSNPTNLTKIAIEPGKGAFDENYSKFLTEVKLTEDIHACFFNVERTPKKKLTKVYYELGWLRIPEGFQHVNYKIEKDKVVSIEIGSPLSQGLLAPLLLLQNKKIKKAYFHFCSAREPAVHYSPRDGSPIPQSYNSFPSGGGCGQIITNSAGAMAFASSIKINPISTNQTSPSSAMPNSYAASQQEVNKHFDNKVFELPAGTNFFIPFTVSERVVCYYFIETNAEGKNIDKLVELNKNLKAGLNQIDFADTLVYHDELGIFITTCITQVKG